MSNSRALTFAVPGRLQTLTGGFLYDRRMTEGLQTRGWEVEVLELPEGFPLGDAARREAAEVLKALPPGRPLVIDGLAGSVLPETLAALASRLPLTLLIHHPLAEEAGLTEKQARQLRESETRSLASVRRVVTTSTATAKSLQQGYGVPAERLRVAQPGTEPAPPARGSGEPAPVLLSVGSLIQRKGQDLLIAALESLRDMPWRLVLAGGERDPGYAAGLRAQVEASGLGERVTFVGELPPERLAGLYDRADLFVLPSRLEGYGMAIAEALARALPVVCSTSAAIVAELPPGSLATVPPGDATALRDLLGDLLADQRRRRELAEGARRARDLLPDWPQAVDAFEQALLLHG